MTPAKAKIVFSSHMQEARKRKLTPYELQQLNIARQVLRHNRRTTAKHNARKRNPPKNGVLIYGQVQTIYAKKTQKHICDDDCKAHGHRYYHTFSSKPKMYGLPDGTLLIKP